MSGLKQLQNIGEKEYFSKYFGEEEKFFFNLDEDTAARDFALFQLNFSLGDIDFYFDDCFVICNLKNIKMEDKGSSC